MVLGLLSQRLLVRWSFTHDAECIELGGGGPGGWRVRTKVNNNGLVWEASQGWDLTLFVRSFSWTAWITVLQGLAGRNGVLVMQAFDFSVLVNLPARSKRTHELLAFHAGAFSTRYCTWTAACSIANTIICRTGTCFNAIF